MKGGSAFTVQLLAFFAKATNFHNRRIGTEFRLSGDGFNQPTKAFRLEFGSSPAFFAKQEDGRLPMPVSGVWTFIASHIGVPAFNTMNNAMLDQEFKRTVNGDRRKHRFALLLALLIELIENIIGTGGHMTGCKNPQDGLPLIREAHAFFSTDSLGIRKHTIYAKTMVMITQFDHCFFLYSGLEGSPIKANCPHSNMIQCYKSDFAYP